MLNEIISERSDYVVDFKAVFEALPGSFLIIQPNPPHFTILEGSDDLFQTAGQSRHTVLGRSVFEAFPENPVVLTATGPSSLRNSFQNVLTTKMTDHMPILRYDVLGADGQFKERYWSACNKPVLGKDGEVLYILHSTFDVTDQVLTTNKIEESESRFRHMVEQSPVAFLLTRGTDLIIESINAPMLRLMGKETEAVIGKKMVEVLPELKDQPILTFAKRVQETGESFSGIEVQVDLLNEDKLKKHYVNVSYTPLIESGKVTGVIHVAHDVTEQVQARQKVEASQEELKRFKFMADQAQDSLVLMRENGTFAYLNKKALEVWGYSEEEGQQLRVPEVDPVYQEEMFLQLFARAQKETIPQFETLHRRKDGHIYPVEATVVGLLLNGEPNLLAVTRDITARKEMEAALKESEERFRIMADAAPNMVWSINPQAAITYVNSYFLSFLGVSYDTFLRDNWLPYVHPEDIEKAKQALAGAIQNRGIFTIEHRMRRHDGVFRWLFSQAAPSYLANGELYSYVGSSIDITDLKEAEEALAQKNAQLVQTNNDLDTFVYTASHDLRSPITTIEALIGFLKEELTETACLNADTENIMNRIITSVSRLQRTIQDLTNISRLQNANQKNPKGEPIDVQEVYEDIKADLVSSSNVPLCQIQTDFQVQQLHFSKKNFRSILYNLLSNALKYQSPDRDCTIHIQTRIEDDQLVLQVKDNGLGLNERQQEQLFTMFRRFHDHVEGTGVGLFMVKRIVENNNGRIEVDSEEGKGTEFRVYLPVAE
ncbi:PAS domain-containing sensor histidine kinase [Rufibacter tibetensis]|uniref:PAS domain-containing sensor histidine kinase n=1 Tax=Rufibacter tibetensis TaxID=512763 RepID=UPI00078449A5|nr:PAS domain-containing sensor histidine kinase [Rufibacter tibetensis]